MVANRFTLRNSPVRLSIFFYAMVLHFFPLFTFEHLILSAIMEASEISSEIWKEKKNETEDNECVKKGIGRKVQTKKSNIEKFMLDRN